MTTMPREHVSVADTAKMIRAALKATFPGVKFSVRSHSYSGGASIDIAWTDGPTASTVDRLVNQYKGADFDGMTDSKTYRTDVAPDPEHGLREIHYGADFIFTQRSSSPELVARIAPLAEEIHSSHGWGDPYCGGRSCGVRLGELAWFVPSETHPHQIGRLGCCAEHGAEACAYRFDADGTEEA